MLTQSGAPGRVIDWTSFSHQKSYGRYQDFIEKYQRSVKEMVNDWFQDNLYLTYSRISVPFCCCYTWICQLDLSILYLIASCGRCHA